MDLFNWKQYIANYPDLKHFKTSQHAFRHFINHGLLEKRTDSDLQFHSFNPKQQKTILFTNARDESNMKEWCAHHLLLGFDCIYIFDHLSKNPIIQDLNNFDSRICVFNITESCTFIKPRFINYATIIANSLKAEWMLYLDSDEFLILNKHTTVQEFINDYPADLIAINWLMFGTSGYIAQPPGLITSNFTKCDFKLNQHTKSLVRPNKIKIQYTPHTYKLKCNSIPLNVIKNKIELSPFVNLDLTFNQVDAYIAHYLYQSEETYKFRKTDRNTDLGGPRPFDNKIHTYHCETDNYDIKNKYALLIFNFINKIETELEVEVVPETKLKTKLKVVPETELETKLEVVPETELEVVPETELETLTETELEVVPETELETLTETELEVVPETELETKLETLPKVVSKFCDIETEICVCEAVEECVCVLNPTNKPISELISLELNLDPTVGEIVKNLNEKIKRKYNKKK